MSEQSTYIERGAQQVFRQPLTLQNADMRCFVLDADMAALEKLCDRYLNAVETKEPLKFVPLTAKVLLAFADIKKATSLDARDAQFGWLPEIDVAFWIPVAILSKHEGDWQLSDIAWFLPYVFVDNAWAVATGREIYGFPKEMGTFAIPKESIPNDPFQVSALVLDHFDPATEARNALLFEVTRNGPPAPDQVPTWEDVDDLAGEIIRSVFGLGDVLSLMWREGVEIRDFGVNIYDHLRKTQVPMVFLKQFRDAADPTVACYQKLIYATADLDPHSVHNAGPLWGDYTLRINDFSSHPIARDVGLNDGLNNIEEAFHLCFSFVMNAGREL